jgi:hypothetical protein
VVPLLIRQFHRDTNGEALEVAPENEVKLPSNPKYQYMLSILCLIFILFVEQVVKSQFKQRKKYEKPPKYGTSTQVHFEDGESGLLD